MDDLQHLVRRVEAIEERNARVEAEKAWEVSMFPSRNFNLFSPSRTSPSLGLSPCRWREVAVTLILRMGTIALMTYVIAAIVLLSIGSWQPFLSALIPMAGFVLSVQTLPSVRRWWIRKNSR